MKENEDDNENKNKIVDDFLNKLGKKKELDNDCSNINDNHEEDDFEKAEREYREKNAKINENNNMTDNNINSKNNDQSNNEKYKVDFNTNKDKKMMEIFLNSVYKKNALQSFKLKQQKIIYKPIKSLRMPNDCVFYKNTVLNICTNDQILQFYGKKIKNVDTVLPKKMSREAKTQYELSAENDIENNPNINSSKHQINNIETPNKKLFIKNKSYYSVQKTKSNFSNTISQKKVKGTNNVKISDERIKTNYNNNFLSHNFDNIRLINSPINCNKKMKKKRLNLLKHMNDHSNPFSPEWPISFLKKNNLKIHFNEYEGGVPFLRVKETRNKNNFPSITKNIKKSSNFTNKASHNFDEVGKVYFDEKIQSEIYKKRKINYKTPGHSKRNNM